MIAVMKKCMSTFDCFGGCVGPCGPDREIWEPVSTIRLWSFQNSKNGRCANLSEKKARCSDSCCFSNRSELNVDCNQRDLRYEAKNWNAIGSVAGYGRIGDPECYRRRSRRAWK